MPSCRAFAKPSELVRASMSATSKPRASKPTEDVTAESRTAPHRDSPEADVRRRHPDQHEHVHDGVGELRSARAIAEVEQVLPSGPQQTPCNIPGFRCGDRVRRLAEVEEPAAEVVLAEEAVGPKAVAATGPLGVTRTCHRGSPRRADFQPKNLDPRT